ncbi:MAG: MFS transporter [Dehalococcoidia bacterium]
MTGAFGGLPSGRSHDSGSYLELFRGNSAFRRLFGGQVVSFCGDWFLTVALLDLVLRLTHSAFLAGLVLVCQSLPTFFLAAWAGTIVDRHDRRRLMIAIDTARILFALLPIAARSVQLLPLAYAGALGISIGGTFFSPAIQSAIPNVVEGEDLARANVLMGSTWGTMLAVGSALGGLVVAAFGLEVACIIDAATFAFSAFILWTIHRPFQQRLDRQRVRFLTSLREAGSYARGHRRVLALLTCKGGFGLGSGVIVLLSVFGRDVFHAGAAGIGVLYGARGIGALFGPFLIRRLGSTDDARFRLIGVAGIVYGLGYAAFAVSPVLGLAAVAVSIAHLGGGAEWMMSTYGLQREVPDDLRGRIFAAGFGLVTLTTSISSVGAGLLAASIGATATALLAGALALVWGLIWTGWTRSLWQPATMGNNESARSLAEAAPSESEGS